ncbi:MAG: HAMP domain-containing histidine kinase [Polyangiaceae bacterium]|nr:HAMP domain-containing histidine kinase [Polyangiaceae bacterium]
MIFDEQGKAVAATQPFDVAPPSISDLDAGPDAPLDFAFSGRRYRGVVVPIPGFDGRRLLLAASRGELDGDSRFVRKAMGTAFAASVVWLFLAIGWLTRRNMREHARIAETLRRVATGDMKARVAGDVSDWDLRRVGSDVDEIAERLGTLVQHQRRFIAHAAHELRSPLTALHGELQQALRKERTAQEYRESLTFCLRASHRLKHLTDDLLELARAEQPAKLAEAVDLDDALADVVESLAPLASEKNVEVQRDCGKIAVLARRSEVERIIRNLLDNAIRHSPKGGVVRLEVTPGDETALLRVRDQGPGVPEAERERVFEPFHRSAPARVEARGAGLVPRHRGNDRLREQPWDLLDRDAYFDAARLPRRSTN